MKKSLKYSLSGIVGLVGIVGLLFVGMQILEWKAIHFPKYAIGTCVKDGTGRTHKVTGKEDWRSGRGVSTIIVGGEDEQTPKGSVQSIWLNDASITEVPCP